MNATKGVVALAAIALATTGLVGPAGAATAGRHDPEPRVVATGLNSPRHLSFAPNGDLYIAESGYQTPRNNKKPCLENEEFGTVCIEQTGSITKLSRKGHQSRVVTGLTAVSSNTETSGPFDVLVHGKTLTIVLGLGADPAARDQFGPAAARLGTVIDVKMTGHGQVINEVADVSAHEASDNPDGEQIDSNPVDLAPNGRGYAVADAGGDYVAKVSRHGDVSTLTVLPNGTAEAPPFLGLPPGTMIPTDAVPTSSARGPDGAWYVSQLVGFPFPVGAANIWRVDRQGNAHVYATGLTNVTDLAWRGCTLYAVQMADEGLLGAPVGSLVRIDGNGTVHTVAAGLDSPYGLAIRGGSAYVTTGSTSYGGGEVVKISLGH